MLFALTYVIGFLAQCLCHWAITETYLKTSRDAEAILKRNPNEKIELAQLNRRCLKIARCVAVSFLLVCGVLLFVETILIQERSQQSYLLLFIVVYSLLAFQMGCLLVWGWTIYKLYTGLTKAKDLLPSQSVFQLHGSLLGLYITLSFAATIAGEIAYSKDPGSSAFDYYFGIYFLL